MTVADANKAKPYSRTILAGERSQRTFKGSDGLQVAMPLGGIGAGCICLNGQGGLQDFSIKHRPDTTARPDGSVSQHAAFALLRAVQGKKSITRLVEGPMPVERVYAQGLKSNGYRIGGFEGLPRFSSCEFKGEYPFGFVRLKDKRMPFSAAITGFNPFVPLDDTVSGLPCAILEYTITNTSRKKAGFEFSYHLSNLTRKVPGDRGDVHVKSRNLSSTGVFFDNTCHPNHELFGNATLSVPGFKPQIKAAWPSGRWFDALSILWREVSSGAFKTNSQSRTPSGQGGGSVLISGSLKSGESITIPVVITWYFPNCNTETEQNSGGCCDSGGTCSDVPEPVWRPWYAGKWKDAADVADYIHKNYDTLRQRTLKFKNALFSSTLPSYVLDAVSANLGIIKSPTVLRQENGNLWAWEGCWCDSGCCKGSCTHVWNYAQAIPHLFPALERTFREQELERSMDETGHVTFRSALPDGPVGHGSHAASDGQLGGILKVRRDYHISGDREWMLRMLPLAKTSVDYCIKTWDPRRTGLLEEPHHNTYDIEFWGPDGMCSSIYVAALAAMAELLVEADREKEAPPYRKLAEKGANALDKKLFNGRFFEQKVEWKKLNDKSFAKFISKVNAGSSEIEKIQKREGPRYQYGKGCISDGVIGAWMALMYGVDTPQNRTNIRKHLKSIFQYNFRANLSEHANTQRPGYAIGNEPGLLLCSWPNGNKPTLPFVYSDEVWTGIEYQVASHLIAEGLVDEGLTIVRAARERYDGRTRNPWNEYECGNYYARAMSSYALLSSLSGFRYSAVENTLWFGPVSNDKKFNTFYSAATGFGTITLTPSRLTIKPVEGTLEVSKLALTIKGKTRTINCSVTATEDKPGVIRL